MKLVKIEMCASSLEVGKHYIWVVDECVPTTVILNKTGDGIVDVRNGGEWFFENALIGELYEVVMEDKSSSPSNLALVDKLYKEIVRTGKDTKFSHRNGNLYEINLITNVGSKDQSKFPTTVVYSECEGNGVPYSRPLVEWSTKFKESVDGLKTDVVASTDGSNYNSGAVK